MNWKLVLQLSTFGLVMGLATVFFIPPTIESGVRVAIFLASAVLIAKKCPSKRFRHGLFVGIANSVWITGAHVLFFDSYIASHPREAEMMKSSPMDPKLLLIFTGPVVGVVSGILIVLLALLAGRMFRKAMASAI